jgi:hydroxylaminobenzene mutase
MSDSDVRSRDGYRLLRTGAVLFLLALFVGLAIPRFAVPRLALSTHLLGLMQGIFLLTIGQLWPRLQFTARTSWLGCVLVIYGCFAAWIGNLLGAMLGAGQTMVPIAAGGARGSAGEEGLIGVLLVSSALSLIAATVFVLWGLRPRRDSRI